MREQINQKTIAESALGVTHNGIKYRCDECDYGANTKSILNVHIESKHHGKSIIATIVITKQLIEVP